MHLCSRNLVNYRITIFSNQYAVSSDIFLKKCGTWIGRRRVSGIREETLDQKAIQEAQRMIETFDRTREIPQPLLECSIFKARYYREVIFNRYTNGNIVYANSNTHFFAS